ncbi:MAG: CDGSH iron-sulfur domain-containing protein [Candidatus Kapaibacterium sp.]
MGTHEYRIDSIVVIYDQRRCIHVANCVHGAPDVFNPEARPWIQPEHAAADRIAEVVMTCPTGALHFERLDGGAPEPVPEENTIMVAADGPLFVRGAIEVIGEDGQVLLKDTRVALCRCGGSGNKPFCDGSHKKNGFRG